MTKVKIEGPAAEIIGAIIQRALSEQGIKVNFWKFVKPGEVAGCRREATRKGSDVSVVAMSR